MVVIMWVIVFHAPNDGLHLGFQKTLVLYFFL
jgi:hypothetical protein